MNRTNLAFTLIFFLFLEKHHGVRLSSCTDVNFLLDSSGSIGNTHFAEIVNFVNKTLIGLLSNCQNITYKIHYISDYNVKSISSRNYNDTRCFYDNLKSVSYVPSRVDIVDLLLNTIKTKNKTEGPGNSIYITITDGSRRNTTTLMSKIAEYTPCEALFLCIGMGPAARRNMITAFTSLPYSEYGIEVDIFELLDEVEDILIKRVTKHICSEQNKTDSVCFYKGSVYTVGQTWYDGCELECTCNNGTQGNYTCNNRCPIYENLPANCRLMDMGHECCLQPQCYYNKSSQPSMEVFNKVKLYGQDRCLSWDGDGYFQWQKWEIKCDYICQCLNATLGYYKCEHRCPHYDVPAGCRMKRSPGKCCREPVCDFHTLTVKYTGYCTLEQKRTTDVYCIHHGQKEFDGDYWRHKEENNSSHHNGSDDSSKSCVEMCPTLESIPDGCYPTKDTAVIMATTDKACPSLTLTCNATNTTLQISGLFPQTLDPNVVYGLPNRTYVVPNTKAVGCNINGTVYSPDEEWNEGCQYACRCMHYHFHYCTPRCPEIVLLPPGCHMIESSTDRCCKIPECLNPSTNIPYPVNMLSSVIGGSGDVHYTVDISFPLDTDANFTFSTTTTSTPGTYTSSNALSASTSFQTPSTSIKDQLTYTSTSPLPMSSTTTNPKPHFSFKATSFNNLKTTTTTPVTDSSTTEFLTTSPFFMLSTKSNPKHLPSSITTSTPPFRSQLTDTSTTGILTSPIPMPSYTSRPKTVASVKVALTPMTNQTTTSLLTNTYTTNVLTMSTFRMPLITSNPKPPSSSKATLTKVRNQKTLSQLTNTSTTDLLTSSSVSMSSTTLNPKQIPSVKATLTPFGNQKPTTIHATTTDLFTTSLSSMILTKSNPKQPSPSSKSISTPVKNKKTTTTSQLTDTSTTKFLPYPMSTTLSNKIRHPSSKATSTPIINIKTTTASQLTDTSTTDFLTTSPIRMPLTISIQRHSKFQATSTPLTNLKTSTSQLTDTSSTNILTSPTIQMSSTTLNRKVYPSSKATSKPLRIPNTTSSHLTDTSTIDILSTSRFPKPTSTTSVTKTYPVTKVTSELLLKLRKSTIRQTGTSTAVTTNTISHRKTHNSTKVSSKLTAYKIMKTIPSNQVTDLSTTDMSTSPGITIKASTPISNTKILPSSPAGTKIKIQNAKSIGQLNHTSTTEVLTVVSRTMPTTTTSSSSVNRNSLNAKGSRVTSFTRDKQLSYVTPRNMQKSTDPANLGDSQPLFSLLIGDSSTALEITAICIVTVVMIGAIGCCCRKCCILFGCSRDDDDEEEKRKKLAVTADHNDDTSNTSHSGYANSRKVLPVQKSQQHSQEWERIVTLSHIERQKSHA